MRGGERERESQSVTTHEGLLKVILVVDLVMVRFSQSLGL